MADVKDLKVSQSEFDLDDVLQPLGGFGKFQIINFIYLAVIILVSAISESLYVFTAGEVTHRCYVPGCDSLVSDQYDAPWMKYAIPFVNGTDRFESCLRYAPSGEGGCDPSSFNMNETVKCDEFIYGSKEWTIARQDWGIHCDGDRWMLTLIGSLNNAGEVVGSLFVGFLSDRIGRKLVVIIMSIIVCCIGTIQSFSINYVMFATLEFIGTCMEGGLFTLPFVLALEIVDPSKRVLAGSIVGCAYPTGEMLIGIVQWLVLDWRNLLRILRIPFLAIVVFYWTMPESVRWLMSKGRNEEALEVLKKIARYNGKELPKDVPDKVLSHNGGGEGTNAEVRRAEFIMILKSRQMRWRILAVFFIWIANTFVFFGMNLNSVSVSDNKFLDFILTCLMEVPSYFSAYLLLDRIGRRATQTISLFLCAAGCMAFAYVPQDIYEARLAMFLIGKYGIALSFVVLDIYTTELFPTRVRGTAISIGHMIGRVAAILAPQTPLLADVYAPLPMLLFFIFALVGGVASLTLPETLNEKLPNTIAEAEDLGKARNDKRRLMC